MEKKNAMTAARPCAAEILPNDPAGQAPDAEPQATGADVCTPVPRDEFAGKGGSYVFDPVSRTRKPAE